MNKSRTVTSTWDQQMHLCKLQLQFYKLQLQFLENCSCSFPLQLLKSVILLEFLLFPKNCSCSFPKNCSCSFKNCNCSFECTNAFCNLRAHCQCSSAFCCAIWKNHASPTRRCLAQQNPQTISSKNKIQKKHAKACLFSSRSKHTKVKHEHRHADTVV